MNQKRLKAVIKGRVQGVSFRYHTQKTARDLGLVGWVRNEPDGSVKLVAEGPEESVQQLLDFVQVGPSHAKVENCDSQWSEHQGEFERFRIR